MEAIFEFLGNNLWLVALISLASFAGMIWSRNQLKGLKAAELLVEGGQYLRAPEEHINEAIKMAEKEGNRKGFLSLLRQVRRDHGHDGVKVGHLYWIHHKLKRGELDVDKTPSFINPELEEDRVRVRAFDAFLKKIEPQPGEERVRIGKEVISRRKQREAELKKSPLNGDELLAVFNEVLERNGIGVITQAELLEDSTGEKK